MKLCAGLYKDQQNSEPHWDGHIQKERFFGGMSKSVTFVDVGPDRLFRFPPAGGLYSSLSLPLVVGACFFLRCLGFQFVPD